MLLKDEDIAKKCTHILFLKRIPNDTPYNQKNKNIVHVKKKLNIYAFDSKFGNNEIKAIEHLKLYYRDTSPK